MITLLGGSIDSLRSLEENLFFRYYVMRWQPYREIRVKTDYLVPLGSNPQLNWNGCAHFKAEGKISRFVDYPTFSQLTSEDIKSLPRPGSDIFRCGSEGGIYRNGHVYVQVPNPGQEPVTEYFGQLVTRFQYPQFEYFAWACSEHRLCIITGSIRLSVRWESSIRKYVYTPYRDTTRARNEANTGYAPDLSRLPPSPLGRSLRPGETTIDLLSEYSAILVEAARSLCLEYLAVGPTNVNWSSYLRYPFHLDPAKSISPRKVKSLIRHELHEQQLRANERIGDVLPRLEANAFDNVQKFDGNMLLVLSKLGIPGVTTGRSLIDLYRSEDLVKGISSWWLANRFGDRLMLASWADVIKSVFDTILDPTPRRDSFIRGRARSSLDLEGPTTLHVDYSVNLAVEPADYNGFMRLIRHAYEWDYFPSLANIWDAVPLSFVVNWFVNVGDIFEDVDRLVQSRYYNTVGIMPSLRFQYHSLLLPGVKCKYYTRWLEHTLNLGVSSVELGLPSTINIVDGISLIASF